MFAVHVLLLRAAERARLSGLMEYRSRVNVYELVMTPGRWQAAGRLSTNFILKLQTFDWCHIHNRMIQCLMHIKHPYYSLTMINILFHKIRFTLLLVINALLKCTSTYELNMHFMLNFFRKLFNQSY